MDSYSTMCTLPDGTIVNTGVVRCWEAADAACSAGRQAENLHGAAPTHVSTFGGPGFKAQSWTYLGGGKVAPATGPGAQGPDRPG